MQRLIVRSPVPIRLNKYLSHSGIASRRNADLLISSQKVSINGKHAAIGNSVKDGDIITVHEIQKDYTYMLYYKPRGEVTAILTAHSQLHPVGRLDKESEGIILYTNDFRVTEKLLSPINNHEKEYLVTVREKTTPRVSRLLYAGIKTQEAVYKKALHVELLENKHDIKVTLTEGKKHEIRRMMNALLFTVLRLVRIRILFLTLHKMVPKLIRPLSEKEKDELLKTLSLS